MSDALSVRELEPRPSVRLRCGDCDVAWSGSADSLCWVCGEPGIGLRSVVRYRERELFDLDFDY
ncbi:MAG: hypothetical protein OEW42_06180 [Acidimicrobiia bacterium]|nr:hypothetical protein [Acidimicrobiia bacterium]MDH5238749.1 hypothetical protein [Acidimicrobiia bacterium]